MSLLACDIHVYIRLSLSHRVDILLPQFVKTVVTSIRFFRLSQNFGRDKHSNNLPAWTNTPHHKCLVGLPVGQIVVDVDNGSKSTRVLRTNFSKAHRISFLFLNQNSQNLPSKKYGDDGGYEREPRKGGGVERRAFAWRRTRRAWVWTREVDKVKLSAAGPPAFRSAKTAALRIGSLFPTVGAGVVETISYPERSVPTHPQAGDLARERIARGRGDTASVQIDAVL